MLKRSPKFPSFVTTLKQENKISRESFTFDLGRNLFWFGENQKTSQIFKILDQINHPDHIKALSERLLQSTTPKQKVNRVLADSGDLIISNHVNKIFDSYAVVGMLDQYSYSFLVDSIKINGQILRNSEQVTVHLDSGNTLIAFPQKFKADFEKFLVGCRMVDEEIETFKYMNCPKQVMDIDFELEFVVNSQLLTNQKVISYFGEDNLRQIFEKEGVV